MADTRRETLQTRARSADGVMVQSRAPTSTEPVGPVSVALVGITLVACVAVVLGAPVALLAIPFLCAISLAAITLHTLRRARAAERATVDQQTQARTLEDDLRTEMEARQNAESRLAWRSRLGSLRRARQGETLMDPESGLLLEGMLSTAVESRIAVGRRRLTPVAVVMLEVLEYVQIDDPRPIDAGRSAELLIATIREADSAFRLDEGGFAVLLEDTDDAGALVVTRRFGTAIESMAPGAVVRAGVACYPAHGMSGREVLDRADEALDEARRWRQHRIEVARAEQS